MAEWLKASDCKSDDVSLRRFKSFPAHIEAGVAQLVEHQPSKLRVAGSSLVSRSMAYIAQEVEHFLGKEEVTSSNLVVGSRILKVLFFWFFKILDCNLKIRI